MEIFQIIAGAASILSLLISIIIFNKVNKIENHNSESMVNTQQNNNTVSGDNAGRDVNKNV